MQHENEQVKRRDERSNHRDAHVKRGKGDARSREWSVRYQCAAINGACARIQDQRWRAQNQCESAQDQGQSLKDRSERAQNEGQSVEGQCPRLQDHFQRHKDSTLHLEHQSRRHKDSTLYLEHQSRRHQNHSRYQGDQCGHHMDSPRRSQHVNARLKMASRSTQGLARPPPRSTRHVEPQGE